MTNDAQKDTLYEDICAEFDKLSGRDRVIIAASVRIAFIAIRERDERIAALEKERDTLTVNFQMVRSCWKEAEQQVAALQKSLGAR